MGKISALGVALEGVPKWVIVFVALTVTVGFSWKMFREPELVTAREANAVMRADLDEYARHIGEQPEGPPATLMDDARGRLTAQRYADGCVVLVRVANGVARSKLVADLAGAPPPRRLSGSLVTPLAAAGRCVNPHPGPFSKRTGDRRGCWVPVSIEYADGCAYVQMFDVCNGTWDGNIRWTRCVH